MSAAAEPQPPKRRSYYVRSVPRHPGRFIPARVGPAERGPGVSTFVRAMDANPAPFVVGLKELADAEWPARQAAKGDLLRREGLPPWPESKLPHAPFDVERYLGRAEEVSPQGNVIATLWEAPSGRRSTAELRADTTRFEPRTPRPGAWLYLWVWSEITETGEPVTRTLARVIERELTDAERAHLRGLLEELSAGASDP